jgi:hypothetical protein
MSSKQFPVIREKNKRTMSIADALMRDTRDALMLKEVLAAQALMKMKKSRRSKRTSSLKFSQRRRSRRRSKRTKRAKRFLSHE